MTRVPARKLNQADADELRAAYEELMDHKSITREGPDGEPVVITTTKQIAEWKGISQARLYELRRAGFKMRRGGGGPAVADGHVPADAFRTLYELSIQQINERDRRIAELEAEVARLKEHR